MEGEKHDIPTTRRDFAATRVEDGSLRAVETKDTMEESGDVELGPRATYIDTSELASLSQEHRDYLQRRHGTLDLHPIPSMDPADP
jgi:hypothetical protein